MDIANCKKSLRRDLLARRSRLTPGEWQKKNAQINSNLILWLSTYQPDQLFLFASIRNEPNLMTTAEVVSVEWKISLALPICDPKSKEMRFYDWVPGKTPLKPNQWGILEPDLEFSNEIVIISPRAVVATPTLGADLNGARIGYGAGYYDRFFEKLPSIIRIGLLFECGIVPEIPNENHDMALDWLITEKRSVGPIKKQRFSDSGIELS